MNGLDDIRIAVLLITSGRVDYTRRTVQTFCEHNDASRFMLLHGDDASEDPEIMGIANDHGFETVHASKERVGGQVNRRKTANAALERGADWILMLENDWEWVRPFPWCLFQYCLWQKDIYCLRLYGKYKEKGRRPAGIHHAGLPGRPLANWQPMDDAPELAEKGRIHWGAPPSVTRASVVNYLLDNTAKDGEAMRLSGEIKDYVARPVENVVFHIGEERTPEFMR